MGEVLAQVLENLKARVTGPMSLRFYLQPAMGALLGILVGLKDTKAGNSVYFWGLFTNPGQRASMLKDGWKSVGMLFVVATVLDVIYQLVVERRVHPLGALTTASVLAIIPYLFFRGLANRIGRRLAPRGPTQAVKD